MAGLPWYCIASDFSGHPKVLELADRLDEPLAGMYVVRLFEHCATQALDGRVRTAAIEGAAGWRGKRGVLLQALVAVGFLEPEGGGTFHMLHGWEERNGARIRKALADAKKPRGNKPRPVPVPRGTEAGPAREPSGTSTGPEGGDGRSETEKKTEAAASHASACEPEPASSIATLTLQRLPEAKGEDDFPRPRLEIVDESGPPETAAPKDVELFRRRLADRLARTTLHLVGGGKPVLDDVERALREVPVDEAVELVYERHVEDVKAGRRPPQTLKLIAQILADEALRRRTLRAPEAARAAREAEFQGAISRARADCPELGRVLEVIRAKVRGDLFERWFVGLRGRLADGVLTVVAPDRFGRDFIDDNYRGWLEELVPQVLGGKLELRIVEAAPMCAAGGQA
jgi:hypothetical protein